MTRFRFLALLAALCLLATACPDSTDEDADGDGTADSEDADIDGDGVDNDDDVEPFDPDVTDADSRDGDEPEAESDEPEPADEPAEDQTEAEDQTDDPQEDEELEPDVSDEGFPLLLGDPVFDDQPLDLEASMVVDGEGRITLLADARLRTPDGWYGASMDIIGPDGTAGVVECSFRPDLPDEPTQCNAFEASTFACGGSTPFTDPGTGPVNIETPFYVNVNGVVEFYPAPVQEGCADFTGAQVTGGFFGQLDASTGQGRSASMTDLSAQALAAATSF